MLINKTAEPLSRWLTVPPYCAKWASILGIFFAANDQRRKLATLDSTSILPEGVWTIVQKPELWKRSLYAMQGFPSDFRLDEYDRTPPEFLHCNMLFATSYTFVSKGTNAYSLLTKMVYTAIPDHVLYVSLNFKDI
ncbi:hypothetical protein TWF225_006651 [Orbilia oligospora]|uniref:Uncharacterized protein n=1 Tax=Orbilia oligospora TaxID=2813651 RepID=A0A8H2HDW8_ORBOL|nr:hypothetical protein TWF225_006651 [Orbilia oligospora]KAF3255137.1 hypothetical protein TWF128_005941 [Orbilia oligospora]TGJ63269.1 hypothetical protein EYR41_011202 [Orbilia oligospora]